MLRLSNNLIQAKNELPRHFSMTSTTFLEGDSDYISVANHADFQIDGADFSAAFWIKLTVDASGTSNLDGIIGIKAGQFRGGGFWFEFNDKASDDQEILFFTSTAGAKTSIATTTNIVHDTWYHVVATYDVSTTTAKLYLNGTLEATDTSMSAPTAYSNPVGVGTFTPYVSCVVKDMAVWNGVVLTDAEMSALYYRKRDPSQIQNEFLKGWWPLDAESATGADNVLDLSGNSHHGTTTNLADSNFDTTDSPTGV
tara:strand:- start:962 stop:1723 length:762 start_codon:yes stop_codon:yes gene_type:complete